MAGVARGDIQRRFAWQLWHLWHWAGSGGPFLISPFLLSLSHSLPPFPFPFSLSLFPFSFPFLFFLFPFSFPSSLSLSLCKWNAVVNFAWQARRLVTFTFVLRGRRGTWSHPPSFCLASVALMALGWLWWRALAGFSRRSRRGTLRDSRGTWRHRVAGVARGDIQHRFAWQLWHLWHWAGSGGPFLISPFSFPFLIPFPLFLSLSPFPFSLSPFPFFFSFLLSLLPFPFPLQMESSGKLCVAGVPLGDIHLRFAWQAWHLVTSTFVLLGKRGTYGTGLALVARLGRS